MVKRTKERQGSKKPEQAMNMPKKWQETGRHKKALAALATLLGQKVYFRFPPEEK